MHVHQSDPGQSRPRQQSHDARLPLLAGPTVWYLLAGASILLALWVIFLADAHSETQRYGIAIFIGIWAPMFGIAGLRAEIMEMREEGRRAKRKG